LSLYLKKLNKIPVSEKSGFDHERETLLDALREEFFKEAWKTDPGALRDKDRARRLIRSIVVGKNLPLTVVEEMLKDIYGWGPVSELMEDPDVTDIWINRHNQIFYEKSGRIYDWPRTFLSEEHLKRFAIRIAASVGRKLDESRCIEDFRLPDGSRVVAVLPPVAVRGTTVTIRKFARLFTLEELAQRESFPGRLVRMFELMVKARLNIFTAGGMGSGKNTFLNALMLCVEPDENLIFVEDPAESKVGLPDPERPDLPVPRVRVFEPRRAGVEGTGEIPMSLIFEKCMRMKPTRILCSECRCPITTYYTLQAMNIGHPGSMSSVHVEGIEEVPLRLSDLLASFPGGAYGQLAARIGKVASAEVVIFLGQINGYRRLLDIGEIRRKGHDELPEVVPLFTFQMEEFAEDGKPLGALRPTGEMPEFLKKRKLSLYLSPEEIEELRGFFAC
jgi:pilus assembly protein CpaF